MITNSQHTRIFGPSQLELATPGRSRRCRVCGDWHRLDKPWPHNCRSEAPRRNPELATPQVAPTFDPFMTGRTETAEYIGDPRAKREYMAKNGLVEYDAGVGDKSAQWVDDIREQDQFVQDFKRFEETAPENLSPDLKAEKMVEGGSLDKGTEIDIDTIEIAK